MSKKFPNGNWGLILLAIVLILASIVCLLERITGS